MLDRQTSYLPIALALAAKWLVALDETILTTIIPTITKEFSSTADIAWYGSGYLMTSCSSGLVFSKFYETLNPKSVFIAAIALFQAGSILCGIAQHSYQLVLGRVVAGIGAGGIDLGTYLILSKTYAAKDAVLYLQWPSVIWAIASGTGPVIGGAITQRASWRVCFYINIPIGVLTIVGTAIFLKTTTAGTPRTPKPSLSILAELNILDIIILMIGLTALIICLQKAVEDGWRSTTVITLLLCSILVLTLFVVLQLWPRSHTIIQPRIARNPIVALGALIGLSNGTTYTLLIYLLPMYLQLARGQTAEWSGILLFPFTLVVSVSSIIGGYLLWLRERWFGPHILRFTQQMLFGTIVTVTGTSLLVNLYTDTPLSRFLPYEVTGGIGIGLVMLLPAAAAKDAFPEEDSYTLSFLTFVRYMGIIVALPIAQTIFDPQAEPDALPGESNLRVKRALYTALVSSALGPLGVLALAYILVMKPAVTDEPAGPDVHSA